ncbi:MAG TPA: phosphoglycerate kinase [Chthoniobacterales bacterium]|nr:phosphoglycerate kinase [Chthoniobacterales bacterium]
MNKLTLRDLEVHGQRVLVRVDFNVPIEEQDGKIVITDDTRMRASLPTINYLREHGAKTILMAHLGRPKGKPVEKYSLRPVGLALHDLIDQPVAFSHDCIGADAEKIVSEMKDGDVTLLENVRFYAGEEANDPMFAESLAKLSEGLYVNDAFGAAHRAHASTAGITKFVKQAAMGFLMEKELKYLQEELAHPAKPFLVILGGGKVSDKIGVIKALMEKADTILICGAMANTFLEAEGIHMGSSRVERDKLDLARELMSRAKEKNVRLLLPIDLLGAEEIKPGAATRHSGRISRDYNIPDGWQAVDIGPLTIALFQSEIARAKTILWNGPPGIFEVQEFSAGTEALAEALAASSATTIIGGGDSVTAVQHAGLADKMTFISTGGGASLELIEGKELPGVAALTEKN